MSNAPEPSQDENTYVIDAENAGEMARLLNQERLLTAAMGGLFPERSDLDNIYDILDIACGPGGWVHQVAHAYPDKEVTGIDISTGMISYASAHAQVRKLRNAHFQVMNALKPLEFPNESFDLVNARFIVAFMPPAAWPKLIQECLRILRPGGIIRLRHGSNRCDSLNSQNKMSCGSTRPFIATCFFANCHIDLNHA
jgi:ubiquinone/menaquinone biosynthesis C-methylase UbiE